MQEWKWEKAKQNTKGVCFLECTFFWVVVFSTQKGQPPFTPEKTRHPQKPRLAKSQGTSASKPRVPPATAVPVRSNPAGRCRTQRWRCQVLGMLHVTRTLVKHQTPSRLAEQSWNPLAILSHSVSTSVASIPAFPAFRRRTPVLESFWACLNRAR